MARADGIRSTVAFSTPVDCPLVELSMRLDTRIDAIQTSVPPGDGTPTVVDVTIEGSPADIEGVDVVFSVGNRSICRITHDGSQSCPCTVLGARGLPIAQYAADDGELTIAFFATDFEQLQGAIQELIDRFPTADVRRMLRAPADHHAESYVLVDTSTLTSRQREMLELAYERGYFDRPRGANATEIADAVGIDSSTFREHLNVALSKLLGSVLLTDRDSQ